MLTPISKAHALDLSVRLFRGRDLAAGTTVDDLLAQPLADLPHEARPRLAVSLVVDWFAVMCR